MAKRISVDSNRLDWQPASGAFGCNPEGLRHGNTLTGDTVVLAHYHGSPDDILKAELVELASLRSP